MDIWRGNWELRNPRSHRHGSKGALTVSAATEESAREEIRVRASRKLFGISTMHMFIHVNELVNMSKKLQ